LSSGSGRGGGGCGDDEARFGRSGGQGHGVVEERRGRRRRGYHRGHLEGIRKDKRLALSGFGTFTVRKRKARTGRNPRTGEEITIGASKTVGFKAAPALKTGI